eukprot:TRINITY_DN37886_c0_g1_i1.p1 TRINITY_DN37886_c0_g1~~TRINITY_DN37886_c0_g1_i1.p1  ORF type:complete len:703 (-),score=157.61 TRINITY_DN37886_c0_g1_i1:171-2129(-)
MPTLAKRLCLLPGLALVAEGHRVIVHNATANSSRSCEDLDTKERGTKDGCRKCFEHGKKNGLKCKYCPFSRICQSRGRWGFGNGCLERDGRDEDTKVTEADKCAAAKNPLREFYAENYHENAYVDPRYRDVRRCIRWILDMPSEPKQSEGDLEGEELARWSCKSALVRETIVRSVLKKENINTYTPEMLDEDANTAMAWRAIGDEGAAGTEAAAGTKGAAGTEGAARSSLLEESSENSAELAGTPTKFKWKKHEFESDLCGIILTKWKDLCYERGYGKTAFRKLREKAAQPNGWLWDSKESKNLDKTILRAVEAGPLVKFTPGAGKSGSIITMTGDGKFIVKMNLKHSVTVDEPRSLADLIDGAGNRQTLVSFMRSTPENLLNRHYALGKISLDGERSYFVVLQDAAYSMQTRKIEMEQQHGVTIAHRKYDLKGKSRSQGSHSDGSTGLNGDFTTNEGILQLSSEQCLTFRNAVYKTTQYLASYVKIDYGFFINIFEPPEVEGQPVLNCEGTGGEPFCFETDKQVITVSILDYLNEKTFGKDMESVFRSGKFWWYDFKTYMYATHICPTEGEKKMRGLMAKCAKGSASKVFDQIDQDRSGVLEEDEYRAFLNSCGLETADVEAKVAEMQYLFDGTKERTIDKEEFRVLLGEY